MTHVLNYRLAPDWLPKAQKQQAANPNSRGDPNRSREYTERTPPVNAFPALSRMQQSMAGSSNMTSQDRHIQL
jgi:hypothetical protein